MRVITAIVLVCVATCDVWAKTAAAPPPQGRPTTRVLPPIPYVPIAPTIPAPSVTMPPPSLPALPPIPRF